MDGGQNIVAVFAGEGVGKGGLSVIKGNDLRLAHWQAGKPAEGHAPHIPFDKKSHHLRWGQVCRKVSHVSRHR